MSKVDCEYVNVECHDLYRRWITYLFGIGHSEDQIVAIITDHDRFQEAWDHYNEVVGFATEHAKAS